MTEEQLQTVLNKELATFFGQMTAYLDKKLTDELTPVRGGIQDIITNLDAMAKRQEISDDERLVMSH